MSRARSHPALSDLPIIVVLAAVYFFAAKLGLRLAFLHPSATPVWLGTGIALAAVLLWGFRVLPGIWLGAFLVNVTTTGSVVSSLGIAAGNTLEALLGAWLVGRWANGARAFERARDIFAFLPAVTAGTVVGATIGLGSLALEGLVPPAVALPVWATWWLGDLVSAALVTPLILLWSTAPVPRWTWRQASEALLVVLTVIGIGLIVFGPVLPASLDTYPQSFLCVPPLLWAAFRFGRRGAVTSAVLLSAVAIWGTLHDLGPFGGRAPNDALVLLQAFMGISTLTNLVLGAVVTERRRVADDLCRSQEALQQQVAEVEDLYRTAPVGLGLLGTDLRYLRINERLAAINGRPVSDHLGRTLREVVPDLADAVEPLHRQVIRSGQPAVGLEITGTTPADPGVPHHFLASHYPVKGARGQVVGVSVVVQDITERTRAEQTLNEHRTRLAGLVDSAMDAIIAVDAAHRVVLFNPAAERMFGCPASLAVGSSLDRFIPAQFHAVHREHIEEFGKTGGTVRRMGALGSLHGVRADGQEFPIEASISHSEVGGQQLFTVILRDITERRLAEAEHEAWRRELELRVHERTAELALAHEELQEEMDERRRLEAEVARASEREQLRLGHELHDGLGQQLTGIGFLLAALHEQLKDVSPAAAGQTLRLQGLIERSIEQTQHLAKGFYPVELEEFGLPRTLKGLARATTRSYRVPCRVRADGSAAGGLTGSVAIQLFRIAQEAVHNAVKHAKPRRITLYLATRDGLVTLTVKDDGVGLPPDGEATSGMGLRIMRFRAQMIGGRLDVRGGRRGGVVVTCSVPNGKPAELPALPAGTLD
jgi:PAS domain S-box-containing protein